MKADPRDVLVGTHYIDGNHAFAEGALAAGCKFFAGYPITPSTEIAERYASRSPFVGGMFIQMEDELGSIAAVIGASLGGKKSMTCTSGPGFSLMMENLGLGIMMEAPFVLVDVQRAGPSTGLPTKPAQADIMQARWGSHGDYEVIALCPKSPQECFELGVISFNLSEEYRIPVLVMMDECVGHMTERVVIPPANKITVVPRKYTRKKPGKAYPYQLSGKRGDLVPPMLPTGEGYGYHVTGLTHDERGYPVLTEKVQEDLVLRLVDKVRKNADKLIMLEEVEVEGASVVIVAYGITARVCEPAIRRARAEGVKVGLLRLITIWPFAEDRIREIAGKVSGIVVPELNMGQISLEVERAACGRCSVISVPHPGGSVHDPEVIYQAILKADSSVSKSK